MHGAENKHKHLEFLQIVITRMAVNSFLLKGWAVTLIAGVMVLSAKDSNPIYIVIAYFPLVIFWILDGYYLFQEKLFRSLYDSVRVLDEKEINFSLNTEPFKSKRGNNWASSAFSFTIVFFYLSLIVLVGVIMFFVK